MIKSDTIIYEKSGTDACLALLNNGELVEFEVFNENGAAEGNVYLGRITKKINLAEDKTGFMVNIGDTTEAFMPAQEKGLLEVSMNEGQCVVVQVQKEAHAEKGAKLVRAIQIAGTYLVYRPFGSYIDVSLKIEDMEKSDTLRQAVMKNVSAQQEGWVVRTAAEHADINDVIDEMSKLRGIYEDIRIKARSANAPALLYAKENPLFDLLHRYHDSLKTVVINDHNLESKINNVFNGEIKYCADPSEAFGLQDMLQKAMEKSVKLPCGGEIHIEETKAMVVIDVDSSNLAARGQMDNLNQEAAKEIARQIILRNLSGKIIIDFAGSTEYRFMRDVMDTLAEELAGDIQGARVIGLSKAGNVEILRRRKRPSLLEQFSAECPTCNGTGRVEP
ncbi:MAG: ribonuclease E/G [Alphaproteobacteria bacterium]|nr:ribonuclease E/G [Alphaproteobacteria bacterium]